jgi:sortase A
MRRAAFLLIALGTLTAIGGGLLGLSAWIGQNDARAIWDQEYASRGRSFNAEFFRLSFPAENTAFIVRDGASDANLLLGPAFVDWSSLPGDNGNSIIAGHRDTHFRILKNVRKGELITVERAGEMF